MTRSIHQTKPHSLDELDARDSHIPHDSDDHYGRDSHTRNHDGRNHEPYSEENKSTSQEEITYFNQAKKYNSTWCPAMTPQRSLDIDQLMGIWHVVEIILHRENRNNKPPKSPPIQYVEGCPSVHLNRNPTQKDILSLLWNEEAGFLEYRFQMTNSEDLGPGYWLSYGPQNGSLTQIPDKPYTQFAGTVQVMKAVATHIVLTFCSPNSQLYSVILSRKVPLLRSESRGIHSMLQRRGLLNIAFTETCRSYGSLTKYPNFKHFAGTVAVIKAVHMELVLMFCSPTAGSQYFSVILTRTIPVSPNQISGIHSLLKRRQITIFSLKETCKNSAYIFHISLILLIINLIIVL